jgi:hypothetical protein
MKDKQYYTEYPRCTFMASSDQEALEACDAPVLYRVVEEGEVSDSGRMKMLRELKYFLSGCTDRAQINNGAIVGWNEETGQFMTTYERGLFIRDFPSPDFDDPVRPATVEEMKEYVVKVGHNNLTDAQIDAYLADI